MVLLDTASGLASSLATVRRTSIEVTHRQDGAGQCSSPRRMATSSPQYDPIHLSRRAQHRGYAFFSSDRRGCDRDGPRSHPRYPIGDASLGHVFIRTPQDGRVTSGRAVTDAVVDGRPLAVRSDIRQTASRRCRPCTYLLMADCHFRHQRQWTIGSCDPIGPWLLGCISISSSQGAQHRSHRQSRPHYLRGALLHSAPLSLHRHTSGIGGGGGGDGADGIQGVEDHRRHVTASHLPLPPRERTRYGLVLRHRQQQRQRQGQSVMHSFCGSNDKCSYRGFHALRCYALASDNDRSHGVRTFCAQRETATDWQALNGAGRDSSVTEEDMDEPPFFVSAPGQRVIAIGDIHGDWQQTCAALRLAGVISGGEKEGDVRWIGGSTVVVQVGDVLDRGDDEIAILSLMRFLDHEARTKGGAVYMVNGNHETLNVAGDFRYVSQGGFTEAEDFLHTAHSQYSGDCHMAFRDWWYTSQVLKQQRMMDSSRWDAWNPLQAQRRVRARTVLYGAGGLVAKELALWGATLIVNDTLFAHGGVLPHHVDYGLRRINLELSRWMAAAAVTGSSSSSSSSTVTLADGHPQQAAKMPFIATRGFDSIVWSRFYSREEFLSHDDKAKVCGVLRASLEAVGAVRHVIGHTPQMAGANGECNGRVWRIDVGMSSGMFNAPAQVLEIDGEAVQVLGNRKRVSSMYL